MFDSKPGSAGASPSRQFGVTHERLAPAEFVEFTLVFPVFAALDQFGADGVFADVFPFLFVGLFRPHPSVPMIGLPTMVGPLVAFGELRLPVFDPILVGDHGGFGRRREEVDVIGHDHVASQQPLGGIGPNLAEQRVNLVRGEPGLAILRANRVEEDRRLTLDIENPVRRMATLGR